MNIIISKLKLPNDMKYEISKYCYDNQGYTVEEIDMIDSLKVKKYKDKLYIKIELLCWKHTGTSIQWLRPRKGFSTGYFTSIVSVKDGINYCYLNKLISSEDWFLLAKDLGDIMFF